MNSMLEVSLLTMLVFAAMVIAACREIAGRLFDQVAIAFLAMASLTLGLQELLGVAAALNNQTEYYARISLMYYSWPRFYNQVQAWVLITMGLLPLIWACSQSELLRSRVFSGLVCLTALAMHWNIILISERRRGRNQPGAHVRDLPCPAASDSQTVLTLAPARNTHRRNAFLGHHDGQR